MKSKSQNMWDLIMDKESQIAWNQIELTSQILRKLIDIHCPDSPERDSAIHSLNNIQIQVMNSLLKQRE